MTDNERDLFRQFAGPLHSGSERQIDLHLVSDATGDTLNAIARASVAQFRHSHVNYHRWNLIRTRQQVQRVVAGITETPGPVLSSIMDVRLRAMLDSAALPLGVTVVNVLDPVLNLLRERLGEPAEGRPGMQYVMDEDYFRRIDAMHYVLAHDDGQAVSGLAEADIVLVGVSRASKTPTSFYLANRGIKAANVPLVPGREIPAELHTLDRPVIGLTLEPMLLVEVRRHRLAVDLGQNRNLLDANDPYIDPDSVRGEIVWARRLCAQHDWPVIDVSRRSIEETAATAMSFAERWHLSRPGHGEALPQPV
ncbi:hypothetical protein FHR90_000375 [Endobacter medicaginis]|uniref:Putative pyruvate, phosphate dikinase regulatory protein n=1 Tax=Endobacter medicaginis TaxID=1181271 RepID=A0A839UZ64_9PROT|nr:pyruvate, water dikinase regulatory protein [Endobacter medicaginis]MBB3172569.1 hypothetical protein [Endobacter medicaginis]MCX5473943.1 kinase/pyrophosphorylase [Endobacter medicaginis]NVN29271.1 kinase/pyrophosphorylase [Endobacter medicaginis]